MPLILPPSSPPQSLTLTLEPQMFSFLAQLARLAGSDEATFAAQVIIERLNVEAEIFDLCINPHSPSEVAFAEESARESQTLIGDLAAAPPPTGDVSAGTTPQ